MSVSDKDLEAIVTVLMAVFLLPIIMLAWFGLLSLVAWALLACVVTLFGPVVPYTWGSTFAVAGLLWGARFVLSAAKGSSKK